MGGHSKQIIRSKKNNPSRSVLLPNDSWQLLAEEEPAEPLRYPAPSWHRLVTAVTTLLLVAWGSAPCQRVTALIHTRRPELRKPNKRCTLEIKEGMPQPALGEETLS